MQSDSRFLLQQKWGIVKSTDPFSISKSLLKKYLPKNAVMIDCGAHVGSDSIELARIFPQSIIHSFEPVPAIFSQLKQNTQQYSNIKSHQLALSNIEGIAKMYVSSGVSDASSSLLMPTGHLHDHPDVFFDDSIDIRTVSLDKWAEENNIPAVDFLWLDMQGFEFKMLEASGKILPTVKAIHTEVSMRETYKNAILYNDFKIWLEAKGFRLVKEAIPPGADMGNALFVRG